MPPRYHHHSAWKAAKVAGRAASQSAKYAEKAAVGLAHWATTDHTGTAKLLTNMPTMEFRDKLAMVMSQLVATLLGIAGSVAVFLLLFTFGLSWLFGM